MLIFGSRGKAIWTGAEPTDHPCGFCGRRLLRPVVIQRYAHVFWIPFFPLRKRAFLECLHCKRLIGQDEGGVALKPALRAARASARTPRRYFTGLVLLAIMMAVGAVGDRIRSWRERGWIAEPAAGDIYVLDATELLSDPPDGFKHVVARVERVTDSKVDLYFGTYGYLTPSGAEHAIEKGDTDKAGYFSKETAPVMRAMLEGWFEKGSIKAIV